MTSQEQITDLQSKLKRVSATRAELNAQLPILAEKVKSINYNIAQVRTDRILAPSKKMDERFAELQKTLDMTLKTEEEISAEADAANNAAQMLLGEIESLTEEIKTSNKSKILRTGEEHLPILKEQLLQLWGEFAVLTRIQSGTRTLPDAGNVLQQMMTRNGSPDAFYREAQMKLAEKFNLTISGV